MQVLQALIPIASPSLDLMHLPEEVQGAMLCRWTWGGASDVAARSWLRSKVAEVASCSTPLGLQHRICLAQPTGHLNSNLGPPRLREHVCREHPAVPDLITSQPPNRTGFRGLSFDQALPAVQGSVHLPPRSPALSPAHSHQSSHGPPLGSPRTPREHAHAAPSPPIWSPFAPPGPPSALQVRPLSILMTKPLGFRGRLNPETRIPPRCVNGGW